MGISMKTRALARSTALVLALSVSGCGATRAADPAPSETPVATAAPAVSLVPPRDSPPSARDVFAALGAHSSMVPSDESCATVADGGDRTLGAIEAHLLGVLADAQRDGDPATATASCEAAGPPWRCSLEVRVTAEDPWAYGISFALGADGAIDPASITCPGTG
jgi:hypothetical protein